MVYNKYVRYWLITGCVLIFFQIVIGGITRITGSGLSITKWEIVTGTFPPMSESEWVKEFDLYKATPQYSKINSGMSLSKFKFIYFWEYFHRLWARMMGFVFLFPLIFFIWKKWVDISLLKQLGLVFCSALLAAVFGWIMVKSGLVERPWVNAYKLSIHLGIALLTLALTFWACLKAWNLESKRLNLHAFIKLSRIFLILVLIQIFFGAIVSGMRASLYYPTWPDMNGEFIPGVLLERGIWSWQNVMEYDKDLLMPALIHVLHRNWGYFVYCFGLFYVFKLFRYPFKSMIYKSSGALLVFLNLQVVLGILILLGSKHTIPVFYGVMHQAIAIFIFIIAIFNVYIFKRTVSQNGAGN